MTLWDLPQNTSASIHSLSEDISKMLQTRLHEMGFMPNEVLVCMKRSPFKGPLVVKVQDCVYSLDKQLAQHILINDK